MTFFEGFFLCVIRPLSNESARPYRIVQRKGTDHMSWFKTFIYIYIYVCVCVYIMRQTNVSPLSV